MADSAVVRMLEDFFAKIDAHIRRVVPTLLPDVTFAAQDDGSVVSNQHRILNFIGAGVTVNDEPASRRVNIAIPGSFATTSTTTVVSTVGTEKVFPLTGNSMAGAPAGWETTGFSDGSWANSVLMTSSISSFFTAPTGAAWISDQAGAVSVPAGTLVRRTFSLPAGTITSATLQINVDDDIGTEHSLFLNGTDISAGFVRSVSTPLSPATIDLPTALLVAGGNNVLALHVSDGHTVGTSPHSTSYRFDVGYTSISSPLVNQLAADVVVSSANTFTTGPSLVVGAGQWLLCATVSLYNSTAASNMHWTVALYNGSSYLASTEVTQGDNGKTVTASLVYPVSPVASTTYSVRVACTSGGGRIRSGNGTSALDNQVGNNASTLVAYP